MLGKKRYQISMDYRLAIATIGLLNILRGIGYYIFSEKLTLMKFSADTLMSEETVLVSIEMHKSLAIAILALGIIIFFLKDLNRYYANKLFAGITMAYFISFLNSIIQTLFGLITIPYITILFFFLTFLYSLIAYLRTK